MEARHRCCTNCPCTRELYRRRACVECNQCARRAEELQRATAATSLDTCQHKVRCHQCKTMMEKLRSVLDVIAATKRNSGTVLRCDCCHKVSTFRYCTRCHAAPSGDDALAETQQRAKLKAFTEGLLKLKHFITTLLGSHNICQHMICRDTELERILNEIRSPIYTRKPVIEYFPNLGEHQLLTQSITESKELLERLLSRIEPEPCDSNSTTKDSVASTHSCIESCICKLLKNQKSMAPNVNLNAKILTASITESIRINDQLPLKENSKSQSKENIKLQSKENIILQSKENTKSEELKVGRRKGKPKSQSSTTNTTEKKLTKTDELETESFLMAKFIKERELAKQKEREKKKEPAMKKYNREEDAMQQYVDKQLAQALTLKSEQLEARSSSLVECPGAGGAGGAALLVRDRFLVPLSAQRHAPPANPAAAPPARTEHVFDSWSAERAATHMGDAAGTSRAHEKSEDKPKLAPHSFTYRLSERAFIANGWTELPEEKIMRRMNLYKMEPVELDKNWFERNKDKNVLYYNSGEILAQMDEECGRWYYRNGSMAIKYYYEREGDEEPRCTAYGCEREDERHGSRAPLAHFDFFGNGALYDRAGRVRFSTWVQHGDLQGPVLQMMISTVKHNYRLLYNQSEGLVVDPKIAFPGRWKWHSLNEPPLLKLLKVDAHLDPKDPYILKCKSESGSNTKRSDVKSPPAPSEMVMRRLEAEKLVQEKLKKSFTHYVTTMKVVKLNEYMSVRISSQTHVVLTYRDRGAVLRLNLGMALNNKEMIGYKYSEAHEVETLYPTEQLISLD